MPLPPLTLSEPEYLAVAEQVQAVNQLWKWAKATPGLTSLASLLRSSKDDGQLLLLRYAGQVELSVDDAETAKSGGEAIYSLRLAQSGKSLCHIPETVLSRRGKNTVSFD